MEKKIEQLHKMRISAVFLQSCLGSADIGENLASQLEIEGLVDEFRSSFPEHVTGDQAEEAKKDFDFFLSLIDKAIRACRQRQAALKG